MCVLNCKALMPTPHVPLFVLITNHYSRWRGSVLGRNEVPRVGYLSPVLWGATASPSSLQADLFEGSQHSELAPLGFCQHF